MVLRSLSKKKPSLERHRGHDSFNAVLEGYKVEDSHIKIELDFSYSEGRTETDNGTLYSINIRLK